MVNPTPIRSMTGFGEAEREIPRGRLRVEIRTVNHRGLNLQLRTPPGLERHEPALEKRLREIFLRGHVKVSVTFERTRSAEDGASAVDLERARRYVEGLRVLQRDLGLVGTIDVGLLAGFRDLFREGNEEPLEIPEGDLLAATAEAADRCVAMREEEGTRLVRDLEGRIAAMEREVAAVEGLAPERLTRERDRLRAALAELLEGTVAVDEERLAREVAHLAERWDIHEEIVRFRSHLQMLRGALATGDPQGVGRRLGFVAQELLREANTMGSKANDARIAASVVALKEEIDRLREQLENVE